MSFPNTLSQRVSVNDGPVYCGAFDPSGLYVLLGTQGHVILLFNTRTGAMVTSFPGHSRAVHDLAVTPSGSHFISGSEDNSMLLWDVAAQRVQRRFTGHYGRVNAVSWCPGSGERVALSASYDRIARIWDIRAPGKNPLMAIDDAKDSLTSIHMTDNEILTGSVDGHCRRYDIRKGLRITDNIQHPVTCVLMNNEKLAFLVASLDSTIRLFDTSLGILLNTFTGHQNSKYSIKCSTINDGTCVVGGSEDGTLFYWDLVSGEVIKKVSAHSQSITSIATHKNGSLLTTSIDGTACLWSL